MSNFYPRLASALIIFIGLCSLGYLSDNNLPIITGFGERIRTLIQETQPETTFKSQSTSWNETIVNVGFVCIGHQVMMDKFIRTMLHFTSSRIAFHIIGDNPCFNELTEALTGQDIMSVILYEWSQYKPQIDWIPNWHYSGVAPLLKLIPHEIFPLDVKQIIMLDTDLFFNDDILNLWNFFDEFKPKQVFGMAKELSNWYREKSAWRGYVKDGGYNSGVMLLDLEKIRGIQ